MALCLRAEMYALGIDRLRCQRTDCVVWGLEQYSFGVSDRADGVRTTAGHGGRVGAWLRCDTAVCKHLAHVRGSIGVV